MILDLWGSARLKIKVLYSCSTDANKENKGSLLLTSIESFHSTKGSLEFFKMFFAHS